MRRFNKRQRAALFIASEGKCAMCGKPLDPHWHGDHVKPFSKGGETDVINGQALCPDCNQMKADHMTIVLRNYQEEFISRGLQAIRNKQKIFVANIAPGGGKSLSALCLGDAGVREGYIDTVIIVVPRLNLGSQIEGEWAKCRLLLPWKPQMGDIDFRTNNPPLIRGGAHGYITTYASLVAQLDLHIDTIKRAGHVMLVFDEAQQLGYIPPLSDSETTMIATESAKSCKMLAELACFVVIMSGTPARADGLPLLLADKHYSAPDENGFSALKADVQLLYTEGVSEGFLRPYEGKLIDGERDWYQFDGPPTKLRLSLMEKQIYRVIEDEGYWQPLVDHVVERTKYEKEVVSPIMAALIAANDIGFAKRVKDYLKKRHADMKTEIAVSEDKDSALKVLQSFRENPDYADILVTVQMAYVGYDCKRISTLGILTTSRTIGYLDQLSARAMRMHPDIEIEKQTCHIIAPDDPSMREWHEAKRLASQAGVLLREAKPKGPGGGPGPQQPLGYGDNGKIVNIQARGFYETGDIDHTEEFEKFETLQKKYRVSTPPTVIKAMMVDLGGYTSPVPPPNSQPQEQSFPYQPKEKREEKLRTDITSKCKSLDVKFFGSWAAAQGKFGHTVTVLNKVYGYKPLDKADLTELLEREKTVNRWKSTGMDGRK